MATCELCGKGFDPEEAELEFGDEFPLLSYARLRKRLCGSCAVQVMADMDDGFYFDECEECGREFDIAEETSSFSMEADAAFDLMDFWGMQHKVLCCDCALGELPS